MNSTWIRNWPALRTALKLAPAERRDEARQGARQQDPRSRLMGAKGGALIALFAASANAAATNHSSAFIGGSDDCNSAPSSNSITGPGTYAVNTTAATSGPTIGSCGSIGNDVWFYYLATSTTTVEVSTCGLASADSVIAVWNDGFPAGSCPTTQLACNDDSCGLQSRVSFLATAGSRYFIEIGGYLGVTFTGAFSVVEVGPPALNDSCATAVPIAGAGPHAYNTVLATTGVEGQNEPLCSFFGSTTISHDIWYSWTATSTGLTTWDFCAGGAGDTKIAVYEGVGCPLPGSAIACNDDSCGLISQLTFPAVAGTSYTLQVGSFPGAAGSSGTFTLSAPITTAFTAGFEIAGTSASTYALTVHNDGTGVRLYASGEFEGAGASSVSNVARWDGLTQTWSGLDSGVSRLNGASARVAAMTSHDEPGPTPASLFVAGDFDRAGGNPAANIARWSTVTGWAALGSGTDDVITSLIGFDDDGAGPHASELVVGGMFQTAGGGVALHIARWNGSNWLPLGAGTDGPVMSLAVFDIDGAGPLAPQLHVGGYFKTAGGLTVNGIARWNGTSWFPVSSGVSHLKDRPAVLAMAAFDEDGVGPQAARLFLGGSFDSAGGISQTSIARWTGSSILPPLAGGSLAAIGSFPTVRALGAFNDGSGEKLYAAGLFRQAGSATVATDPLNPSPFLTVARYNGTSWAALGSGIGANTDGGARTLAFFDDDFNATPSIFVAGHFGAIGNNVASGIARWSGTTWLPLGSGRGLNAGARCMELEGGPGSALLVGGDFTTAGNVRANRVARWNDATSTWSALGLGLDGRVNALEVGGLGTFAGGEFENTGTTPRAHIARWTGTTWVGLGSGTNLPVNALASFGSQLIAGGSFGVAGGVSVANIAGWNGASWSPLGTGVNDTVRALEVFDDSGGASPKLIVGGEFNRAGSTDVASIARWDGATWTALGSGLPNGAVYDLAVFDDGSGPRLYAAGDFSLNVFNRIDAVARWNFATQTWELLGSGFAGGISTRAHALTPWVVGGLPKLVVGGDFDFVNGGTAHNVALYGAGSWTTLGNGADDRVLTLQPNSVLGGSALFLGGEFSTTDSVPSARFARNQ